MASELVNVQQYMIEVKHSFIQLWYQSQIRCFNLTVAGEERFLEDEPNRTITSVHRRTGSAQQMQRLSAPIHVNESTA